MASNFSHVDQAPAIEVFALIAAFNADTSPDKVNLSVGGGWSFSILDSSPFVTLLEVELSKLRAEFDREISYLLVYEALYLGCIIM